MRKPIFILLSILLFVIFVFALYPLQILTVIDGEENIKYWQFINEKDQFTISCIHSVEKTPVDEIYSIEGEEIILKETVYSDFGAGLPYQATGKQKFSHEGNKFRITGYDMKIPVLYIRVGRFADHTYKFEGNEHKLANWARPGESLAFDIEKTNLFHLFWKYMREGKQ